jgi:hypothetical protein
MEKTNINNLRRSKGGHRCAAFHIGGWAAWTPGIETESAWHAWACSNQTSETNDIEPSAVAPAMLRRRVSPLGQAALRAAWGLPKVAESRIVSASRHGEFGRTLSILESLADKQLVSPADFSLSVHHALAGLLSIAAGNRQGHSAIAAGAESFGYALMEALGCLAEDPATPVLLLYYDEPLPKPFDVFSAPNEQPVAMAFSISAEGDSEPFWLAISPTSGNGPRASLQALDFLHFVLSGETERVSFGERLDWRWTRHASAA